MWTRRFIDAYDAARRRIESVGFLAVTLRRPVVYAEAHLDIQVRGVDQIAKRPGVELAARVQFHMPHAFAASLQEARGVLEHCAVEEPDVDMSLE